MYIENDDLNAIGNSIPKATLDAFEAALEKVEKEKNRVKSNAEILFNYITNANKKNVVVKHKKLLLTTDIDLTKDDILHLLLNKNEFEELKTIDAIKTEDDIYYYNNKQFTERFATVQALIQSKDILKTIASTVRYESNIYPRPSSLSTFTNFPYFYSKDEVLGALARMAFIEEYQDIKEISVSNGNVCIYSNTYLSEKYAKSLAEWEEVERKENQ